MDVYVSKSSYMDYAFRPELVVDNARTTLKDVNFDTVVGTGLSGALVLPTLAHGLDVYWAVVRKPSESHHAERVLEGKLGHRWLFVDDFIASGATLARVRLAVAHEITRGMNEFQFHDGSYAFDFSTRYVGAYLYRANHFSGAT